LRRIRHQAFVTVNYKNGCSPPGSAPATVGDLTCRVRGATGEPCSQHGMESLNLCPTLWEAATIGSPREQPATGRTSAPPRTPVRYRAPVRIRNQLWPQFIMMFPLKSEHHQRLTGEWAKADTGVYKKGKEFSIYILYIYTHEEILI